MLPYFSFKITVIQAISGYVPKHMLPKYLLLVPYTFTIVCNNVINLRVPFFPFKLHEYSTMSDYLAF